MALFGRRQPNDIPAKPGGENEPPRENAQPRAYPRPDMVTAPPRPSAPLSATPVATAHMAAHPSAPASHPSAPALHPTAHITDPARRGESIAAPTPPRRTEEPRREERSSSELDGKKLIVGKQIVLSGEIKACEKLVVEGKVEASLTDSHSIEILKDGLFKGAATIDVADISGRFEGDLIVRQRLMVRATGHIVGSVRYSEIEIERGGVIAGDMRPLAEGDGFRSKTDPMSYGAGSGGADDGAPDR
ncbi:MAG: polymer-forming cytoskeletal protein [Dongiaceae bacterium]